MTPFALLGAFFVLVMVGVTLVGYAVLSRRTARTAQYPPAQNRDLLQDTLLKVGEAMPARQTQAERFHLQLNLAGYRQPNAAQTFSGVKSALALGLGLVCAALKMAIDPDLAGGLIALVGGAGLGYLLPDRFLEFAVKRRARRLLYGIPMALDLMVLGLEAGQTVDAALAETARELRSGYPELASEFNQVHLEMLASRSRPEVYQLLRERNSEPEMKRMAQVLIDSERFGSALAPALRTHVRFLRIRLRQQAQEQARKVSVKLIFPVFFLIFPAVILITLGPAIIQIHTQLGAFAGP